MQPSVRHYLNDVDEARSIDRPYLLVIGIAAYVDDRNVRWVDALWHKDLLRHLEYLDHLILACPHVYADPPPGTLPLEGYHIEYVPLALSGGKLRDASSAWSTWQALWRATQRAQIVHLGVGTWHPWSASNIATIVATLQGKFRIVIVESAPWRLVSPSRFIFARLEAVLIEWVARLSVSTAHLSIFTHSEYKSSLLAKNRGGRGHVIHASWIEEEYILGEVAVCRAWSKKREKGATKLLFAGRLLPSKGVRVLLAALRLLPHRSDVLRVDIMGEGELEGECRAFIQSERGAGPDVRWVAPIEYGARFFDRLQDYSAVLIPSISDEQPRIVFDAMAVAVPVLASSTPGLRDCVEEGVTGRLFAPGSAEAIADAVRWALTHASELQAMGMRAWSRAKRLTHREMHRQRQVLLHTSSARFFASQ